MAKNMNSTQFRTVDVDAYDEDQYQDEAKEDLEAVQQVSDRAAEVKQLLNQTKTKQALKIALQNPPTGNRESDVQKKNYETVAMVLNQFKSRDIDSAMDELDNTEVDVLMKYIYKGFTCNPDKSGTFLTWHEKAFKKGGLGSIIRVMVDRKGV